MGYTVKTVPENNVDESDKWTYFPSEGCVKINGEELRKERDFPESLGLLLENPYFLTQYTGYQNLKLLASIKIRLVMKTLCMH